MRRGFGLITAIIILMAVASLMALTISLSSSTVKNTTDIYLKEQAELLARSATEYALLAISGHDNSINCVQNINITYPTVPPNHTHEANLTIYYIGNAIPGCANVLDNAIATNDSNLTVLIDTTVTVNPSITTEPIRVHRRTLQKP